MAWARVDDGWWAHPKTMRLSLAASGLWARALSWSCHQRCDFVPEQFLTMVGADESMAAELVAAGLWIEDDGGWRIHDWEEYQELSLSEKRAQAGRKGAEKRWSKEQSDETGELDPSGMANDSNEDLPDMANAMAGAHPGPSPPNPKSPPGGNGEPFYKRLGQQLREDHDVTIREQPTLRALLAHLLTQAQANLPEDRHRGIAIGLIADLVERGTGEPLADEARSHTARLVSTHDPAAVLEAFSEALDWGAGIAPEYADDPLALSKYVKGVLNGKDAA